MGWVSASLLVMPPSKDTNNADDITLFDLEEFLSSKPKDKERLESHLWTHQKADLIKRYLWQFLSVTKNGVYIDAFAGPQKIESKDKSWAAKQVLDMRSQYLDRACLFEMDESKMPFLNGLVDQYHKGWTRLSDLQVEAFCGDSNIEVPAYLKRTPIVRPNKAAFALLDQRTHECTWSLVECLANHKQRGNKIEIFYFLAQGWMNRSVKSAKTDEKLDEIRMWWGSDDYEDFINLSSFERAEVMQSRFLNELGYNFAHAFPMRKRGKEGQVMFWLIHASDHPRANPLMASAYRSIGLSWSDKKWKQTDLEDFIGSD